MNLKKLNSATTRQPETATPLLVKSVAGENRMDFNFIEITALWLEKPAKKMIPRLSPMILSASKSQTETSGNFDHDAIRLPNSPMLKSWTIKNAEALLLAISISGENKFL